MKPRDPASSWTIANIVRRIMRARRFPHNTCPASRHAQMIGENFAGRGGANYAEWLAKCPEDREHIASSILVTVELLFKARTEIARLKARFER